MKEMKTEIQETELYKKFKKALNITMDMRADDNPFVVECCKIADEYASQFRQEWIPVEERLPDEGRDVYTTVIFNEEESFVVTSFIRPGNIKRWAHNHGFVTAWQYISFPQPYNPTKS